MNRSAAALRVVVVSFKECWRDESGAWFSDGGFPLQMRGVTSLFGSAALMIVERSWRSGGIPLPRGVDVIPLVRPTGHDLRRKLSVASRIGYYVPRMWAALGDADVVHTPLPGDLPLLGMMVGWMRGKRLLARYGGSWASNSQTSTMNRVTRTLMRRLGRRGHVMLVTGEGRGEPAPGLHWIFSTAMSEQELASIPAPEPRGLCAPPRLIYAGRLSPEKGVHILVEALGRIARDGETLPALTIAGEGPEREALQAAARELRCASAIRWTGQLDRAALSSEMRVADVCVQPSLTEGFSKAWIDAMAHGLPVVSSRVGAAAEVLGEDGERGWLVEPGDAGALARSLREVMRQPRDWPALRRRCREYAEQRTLERWSRRIAEICAARWGLTVLEGKLAA